MPLLFSIKPEATGSKFLSCIFASNGVRVVFFCGIGPAVPERFIVASPGNLAESSNGDDFRNEKFFTVRFTSVYWNGFRVAGNDDTIALPLVIFSSCTLRSGTELDCCDSPGFVRMPPMLEKFHFPAAFWIS